MRASTQQTQHAAATARSVHAQASAAQPTFTKRPAHARPQVGHTGTGAGRDLGPDLHSLPWGERTGSQAAREKCHRPVENPEETGTANWRWPCEEQLTGAGPWEGRGGRSVKAATALRRSTCPPHVTCLRLTYPKPV